MRTLCSVWKCTTDWAVELYIACCFYSIQSVNSTAAQSAMPAGFNETTTRRRHRRRGHWCNRGMCSLNSSLLYCLEMNASLDCTHCYTYRYIPLVQICIFFPSPFDSNTYWETRILSLELQPTADTQEVCAFIHTRGIKDRWKCVVKHCKWTKALTRVGQVCMADHNPQLPSTISI